MQWTAPVTGKATIDTAGSTFDTVLALYDGTVAVAGNDDLSTSNRASRVTTLVTAGTTYLIAVDGKAGASGATKLTWKVAPANDAFGSRAAITGTTGLVTGANLAATRESAEPLHAGVTGGTSIWFKWKAPASGPVSFDTADSAIDTLLAVYTGTSLSALTPVAANDDAPERTTSRVTFTATANTTYVIALDGKAATAGAVRLAWAP